MRSFVVSRLHTAVILLLTTYVSAYAAAPANDDVLQAVEITGTSFTLSADVLEASRQPFEPLVPNLHGKTVWWRWTAPESGIYAWSSAASQKRAAITVLTTDGLNQWNVVSQTYLRPLPGIGLFGQPVDPDLTGSFPAIAGQTYWFQVDGVRGGPFGDIFPAPDPLPPHQVSFEIRRLEGNPPANDAFAGRFVATLAAPVLEGTLALATAEAGEPVAHGDASRRTLWWEWTAPGRGTATIRFNPTNTFAVPLVAVYQRAPWQQLQPFASSATEFGNECVRYSHARDALDFDTEPGVTYFLQIDAFPDVNRSLPFQGQLSFTPAPTNDLLTSPTVVTGPDWSELASNVGATGSASDPKVPGQPGSSSIWYRWPLPSHGLLQITIYQPTVFAEPDVEILPPGGGGGGGVIIINNPGPCSGPFEDLHPAPPFAPVIAVFSKYGSAGDLPLLQYQTHATNDVWVETSGPTTWPETEAWVQIDGPQGVTGSAQLNAHLTPPPRNDSRGSRIVLPSTPVRVTGRTAGATAEPGEVLPNDAWVPAGFSRNVRRTVWWEWKAPSTGLWAFRVITGIGDYFVLYRGTYAPGIAPAVLTLGDTTLFRATAGEVFQIGVFELFGYGSNVEFRINEAVPPRLGMPRAEFNGLGGLRWAFEVPLDWDLPFAAETSPDLRTWTEFPVDWTPRSGVFHLPFDPSSEPVFFRLRVGTP